VLARVAGTVADEAQVVTARAQAFDELLALTFRRAPAAAVISANAAATADAVTIFSINILS
jgi:hypothetical protein